VVPLSLNELQARFTLKSKLVTRVNAVRRLLGFPLSGPKFKLQRDESGSVSVGAASLQLFKGELRDFLSIVSASRPTILFLDDMQWVATLTLDTVQFLNEQHIPDLLLVVAMRDGFDIPHQLHQTKHEIQLKSLLCHAFSKLVSRQLQDENTDIDDLVNLLHSRTGGNPLFAMDDGTTSSLIYDNLVYRHTKRCHWTWDLEQLISETSVSDYIVL
jgi:predicted ATPase